MRLFTSALLVLTVATSAAGGATHIHLYADHDHGEHHHGPAAHHHALGDHHASTEGPVIGACDPGEHAITMVARCVTVTNESLLAMTVATATPDSPAVSQSRTRASEVRVHGPPSFDPASPRAPPLTRLI